jgi:hypothetical protein
MTPARRRVIRFALPALVWLSAIVVAGAQAAAPAPVWDVVPVPSPATCGSSRPRASGTGSGTARGARPFRSANPTPSSRCTAREMPADGDGADTKQGRDRGNRKALEFVPHDDGAATRR